MPEKERAKQAQRSVFLTGATGLVGSYLLKTFLEHGRTVYALARPHARKNPSQRVMDSLRFWGVSPDVLRSPLLQVVEGDVGHEHLGISGSTAKAFLAKVSEVFHCAAITDLNKPWDAMRNVNVEGTRRVLDLALLAQDAGMPVKVNHVSTAYVYGDFRGAFTEHDLNVGQSFDTNYEKAKFEAELLVGEYRKKGLWVDVYRPSIVIGESSTGKTFQMKHIYQFVNLASRELFDTLPIEGCRVSLVPVDVLARAIYALSQQEGERNRTYHPFPRSLVPVKEVLEAGSKVIGYRMPRLVKADKFDPSGFTPAQKALLKAMVFSVNFETGLDSQETNVRLKALNVAMPAVDRKMIEVMIAYAKGK